MLERTAGCFETGCLRRLLPTSRKTIKSRRTLHSAFWNHAAGDTGISPLWAVLAHFTERLDRQTLTRKPSHGKGRMLLEFLYPAGTMHLSKLCSVLTLERREGKSTNFGQGKLSHRQYTSSTKSLMQPQASGSSRSKSFQPPGDNSTDELLEILGVQRRTDYAAIWQQFPALSEAEQNKYRAQLFKCLSISNRRIDAERLPEIFDAISVDERMPWMYDCTIRAYLKMGMASDAIKVQASALTEFNSPIGFQDIIAYLIKDGQWVRTLQIWKLSQQFQHSTRLHENHVFTKAEALPGFPKIALELAEMVQESAESPDSEELRSLPDSMSLSDLIMFASQVIHRALVHTGSFDKYVYMRLMKMMQEWGSDTASFYQDVVITLACLRQPDLVKEYYQDARRNTTLHLSHKLLHSALKVFCHRHDVSGMQEVIDDFFRIHGFPSRLAYKMCMTEFARQGDVETVRALFDQYTTRCTFQTGRPLQDVKDIIPLLQVHAKRGEVSEVVRYFNQIGDNYGLQPDLVCWNILLNVYGKVHDIDNAYACFEHLLYSETDRADGYTFGTMMSICVARGDLQRALEVYKLSEDLEIEKTAAMIDCLVLGHAQHDQLEQAEKICESALKTPLVGSRTRMWNYLLVAHAMKRDIQSVHRLLQRMLDANIDHDEYTYSALFQALCMCKQPDTALNILRDIMPEAGIQPTSFHYAVIMGGYIANGEPHKVFWLQSQMFYRNINPTSSTQLLTMKASVEEDMISVGSGTDQQQYSRALQIFEEAIGTVDLRTHVNPARKGAGRLPIDISYPTMFYSYIMYVFAENREPEKVESLFERFKQALPQFRRNNIPISVLTALMISRLHEADYDGVKEGWEFALVQARIQGRPHSYPKLGNEEVDPSTKQFTPKQHTIPIPDDEVHPDTIVHTHQLDLTTPLRIYMEALDAESRIPDLHNTVTALLTEGFVLDNGNWNQYITILTHQQHFSQAFSLCESKLMDGWTGWPILRWHRPERNRLSIELRNFRKQPRHLRPLHTLMLMLARAYLDIRSAAVESDYSQVLLDDLETSCPRIMNAIKTMPRTDADVEREALSGH